MRYDIELAAAVHERGHYWGALDCELDVLSLTLARGGSGEVLWQPAPERPFDEAVATLAGAVAGSRITGVFHLNSIDRGLLAGSLRTEDTIEAIIQSKEFPPVMDAATESVETHWQEILDGAESDIQRLAASGRQKLFLYFDEQQRETKYARRPRVRSEPARAGTKAVRVEREVHIPQRILDICEKAVRSYAAR